MRRRLTTTSRLLLQAISSAPLFLICFFWAKSPPGKHAFSATGLTCHKLGFPPNKASGAYQRHLDCVLQTKMHWEWYTVQVPSHDKHDQPRSLRQTPVLLPYDEVIGGVMTSATFAADLGAKASSGELPDAFYEHPNCNGRVDGVMDVPIGLFVDGVPTVKRDS